jgi:hypothetical protein
VRHEKPWIVTKCYQHGHWWSVTVHDIHRMEQFLTAGSSLDSSHADSLTISLVVAWSACSNYVLYILRVVTVEYLSHIIPYHPIYHPISILKYHNNS